MLEDTASDNSNQPYLPQAKSGIKILAIASPILATLGFVVLTIPLLGLMTYNSTLYGFLAISPYLAAAIELVAIISGIIVVKKLPKKTSARGVAAAGIYIGSVVFVLSAAAAGYL
jgi:hypothetical protein